MRVQDFLSTKRLSSKESQICISVYGDQEMEAEAWEKELKDKVTFLAAKEVKDTVTPEAETEAATEEEKPTETETKKKNK